MYKGKQGLISKVKEGKQIEIFTMVSGLPFPQQRAQKLKETSDEEIESYNKKDNGDEFEVDLNKISDYVNDNKGVSEELDDFSVFDEGDEEGEVLDWENF